MEGENDTFTIMISNIIPKRFLLGGIFAFCILVLYYFYSSHSSKGVQLPPVLLHDLVNDGVTSFSRLRFDKEADVVAYDAFTRKSVYTANRQYFYEVALPWTKLEAKNRDEVIAMALEQTQAETEGAVSARDFQHGLRRTLPGIGEEYTLVFRTRSDVFVSRLFRKLEGPLVTMTRYPELQNMPVDIVMPLSGRVDSLRTFLNMLEHLLDEGENIRLTVAAFADGPNGTAPVESTLRAWRYTDRARLVTLAGGFSRGLALMRGAAAAAAGAAATAGTAADSGSDPLLFFCDVDMEFTAVELEKCRLHAQRGEAVYYPVVFSQYNWRLAATLKGAPDWMSSPPGAVSADTGHWRVYGFGMSCQYYSDFTTVSGSFLDVDGWGGEDEALYRKFIERYRVVRAYDPDLQHHYHKKECSDDLSPQQYRGCVFTKITNEGTKLHLGLLALGTTGELGARGYDVLRLLWWQTPTGWVVIALSVLLAVSVMLNIYQHRCRLRF